MVYGSLDKTTADLGSIGARLYVLSQFIVDKGKSLACQAHLVAGFYHIIFHWF